MARIRKRAYRTSHLDASLRLASFRGARSPEHMYVGRLDVEALLQSWLDELRTDGLHLAAEPAAGANQNLWCISIPSDEQITMIDLLAFLQSAIAIRGDLALSQPVRPVTFYAWHDEMAGQLRFSTACCTRDTLPFGAKLALVDDASEIVAAFVRSPYRDGIPWNELEESTHEEVEHAPTPEAFVLKVWAVDLCPIAT